MEKNDYTEPIVDAILDYLTRNNIAHQITNEHWIILPKYTVDGAIVPIELFYDTDGKVLLFKAQGKEDIQEDDLYDVYTHLNMLNEIGSLERYYVSCDGSKLTYVFDMDLKDRIVNDAELKLHMDVTARSFQNLKKDIEELLKIDIK